MSRTLTTLLAGALLALLPASAQAGVVQPGDQPDYTWRSPLVNGMGRTSLADLQGKLVLVEFWGTR
jgi:hypothetical protein